MQVDKPFVDWIFCHATIVSEFQDITKIFRSTEKLQYDLFISQAGNYSFDDLQWVDLIHEFQDEFTGLGAIKLVKYAVANGTMQQNTCNWIIRMLNFGNG